MSAMERILEQPKSAHSSARPALRSVLCPVPALLPWPSFAGQRISVSFTDVFFGLIRKVLFSLLFALSCVSTSGFYLSPSLAELLKWKACFSSVRANKPGRMGKAEKGSK